MNERVPKIDPPGEAACPCCGGRFKTAELMAAHLSASVACRRDRVEADEIQRVGSYDKMKRLVLTESLFLKVWPSGKVMMYGTPVEPDSLGDVIAVDTWHKPSAARKELMVRRGAAKC